MHAIATGASIKGTLVFAERALVFQHRKQAASFLNHAGGAAALRPFITEDGGVVSLGFTEASIAEAFGSAKKKQNYDTKRQDWKKKQTALAASGTKRPRPPPSDSSPSPSHKCAKREPPAAHALTSSAKPHASSKTHGNFTHRNATNRSLRKFKMITKYLLLHSLQQ